MLNIVTTEGKIPDVEEMVGQVTRRFPKVKTIVQNINSAKSNIARGEAEYLLYGDGFIEEKILGYKFRIYANSFFQTNTLQAEKLYATALAVLELTSEESLLDLYCGTGSIGICASRMAREVTGIELEPSAIKAAEQNAMLNGIDNIRFFTGSVQEFLAERKEILSGISVAVVDPPRAGLHPKALKGLTPLGLERLVYVSCNPATFARDAAELRLAGYRLCRIIPVDMFPHTMHIELVASFRK
jgi:23S rRNA (uracil1939-C5)-methyltransferase